MDTPGRPPRSLLATDVLLVLALAAGVAWWAWLRAETGLALEDALITFRYARNLAAGNGFVFNPGERVLGTTTPLLTLLLAGAGRLAGPDAIPAVASWLMPAVGAGAAVCLALLVRHMGFPAGTAILAVVFYFAASAVAATSIGGMETPLVSLWMVLGLLLVVKRRLALAAVAGALLVLTRIDGVLWAALLFGAAALSERRVPLRAAAIGALLLAPWFAFSTAYFGALLPHSVVAKRVINPPPPSAWSMDGVRRFFGWYVGAAGVHGESVFWLVWGIALMAGAVRLWRTGGPRAPANRVVVLFPLAYGAFLYFGRAPGAEWYLVPALWCALIIAAAGATAIVHAACRRDTARSRAARATLLVAFAVVFAALHGRGLARELGDLQQNEREARAALGLWLRDRTPPSSLVAMEAIGYQGFYSERPVVDLAGLVSPSVVEARRTSDSNAETFMKVLRASRPDFVVLRSYEVDENSHFHGGPLFESDADRRFFASTYRECRRFHAPHRELWRELSDLTVFGMRCP